MLNASRLPSLILPIQRHAMTITEIPPASPAALGLSADRLNRIGTALSGEIERRRLPGAVALVARRGRLAYLESFGVRDPKTGAAMTDDTIFRIYSMTKPLVSVAAMMLLEEGRILLADPIAKYLPEFATMQVAVEHPGAAGGRPTVERVPAARAIMIHDLLRHTSGLTYEFRGSSAVHRMYIEAKIFRRDQTAADQAATLAGLPLLHQPGTRWEYSRSTDVLGRLLEVVHQKSLGEILSERIFKPLAMADTGFYAPQSEHRRLAEAFEKDPDTGLGVSLIDVREPPQFESGGGGLVSTARDYARFLHAMLNGGTLGGVRILSRKTVEFMTADHVGPLLGVDTLAGPGYGFGLGFAVRRADGLNGAPGSAGEYNWGGAGGTWFWVDPKEQLVVVLMTQAQPGAWQREFKELFRQLVYQAIVD